MVLPLVLFAAALAPSVDARVLFLGNSHTLNHDIPMMVRQLMLSDGRHRRVETVVINCGHLADVVGKPQTWPTLRTGKFTHVVLQAQKISMSHKIDYSKKDGLDLAREAERLGARAIFFSEWPRKGIVETDYIFDIYSAMAKQTGAEVAATGHAWDRVLAKHPKLKLWASDGNHSALPGAYLAALTIYFVIVGPDSKPNWRPQGVDAALAEEFAAVARKPR